MMENPKVISAGGLLLDFRNNQWETVIVGSGNPIIWRIPKGMQTKMESVEETAIREVREETGLNGTIICHLGNGEWTYKYEGQMWDETCFFYLLKFINGDISEHDDEYENVIWVALSKIPEMLFYDIEKQIAVSALFKIDY